ncbi:MAG: hypothetical protein ACRD19_11500, partial [Terriglobia bacterium]
PSEPHWAKETEESSHASGVARSARCKAARACAQKRAHEKLLVGVRGGAAGVASPTSSLKYHPADRNRPQHRS